MVANATKCASYVLPDGDIRMSQAMHAYDCVFVCVISGLSILFRI